MISIIIPVYKKTEEFLKNLENNLKFIENDEVIIVNDDPEISLKQKLTQYKVKLIENTQNKGFGQSVNIGVSNSSGKYIFLLNSDVELNDSSYKNTVEHFEKNKKLFGICFAQQEIENKIVGKNKIYWENGFFRHKSASNSTFGFNSWAEGGASIFSKEKFLSLGGFDDLYSPFYWEDIDLSYRAWKKGFEIYFEPKVLVKHYHETTISFFFSRKTIKKISYRNQFIFIWKNITDINLILSHILLLPINFVYFTIKGELEIFNGFFNAFAKLNKIINKRKEQRKDYLLSDNKVFNKINEK